MTIKLAHNKVCEKNRMGVLPGLHSGLFSHTPVSRHLTTEFSVNKNPSSHVKVACVKLFDCRAAFIGVSGSPQSGEKIVILQGDSD